MASKVKSAMVYPVVVLVAAFGILAFMLTSVIPKFEGIEILEWLLIECVSTEFQKIPGTEKIWSADLVLLAMQSLVVWAINEGLASTRECDR